MRSSPSSLILQLKRLRDDERGMQLVEFALGLPLLLIVCLMALEVAHYALANLRVSQMAMLTADNAGRVRISIDEADINDLMTGAKLMSNGLNFASHGRIILSDLEQRTQSGQTANQWIRWQRCSGALNVTSTYGVPLDKNGKQVTDLTSTANADHGAVEDSSTQTGMGSTSNQIAASTSTAVMFVEVVYDYQPIVPINFLGSHRISYTSAFNVRQRTNYSLTNTGSLAASSLADCKLFAA